MIWLALEVWLEGASAQGTKVITFKALHICQTLMDLIKLLHSETVWLGLQFTNPKSTKPLRASSTKESQPYFLATMNRSLIELSVTCTRRRNHLELERREARFRNITRARSLQLLKGLGSFIQPTQIEGLYRLRGMVATLKNLTSLLIGLHALERIRNSWIKENRWP